MLGTAREQSFVLWRRRPYLWSLVRPGICIAPQKKDKHVDQRTREVELELLSHNPSAPLAGIMDLTGGTIHHSAVSAHAILGQEA